MKFKSMTSATLSASELVPDDRETISMSVLLS